MLAIITTVLIDVSFRCHFISYSTCLIVRYRYPIFGRLEFSLRALVPSTVRSDCSFGTVAVPLGLHNPNVTAHPHNTLLRLWATSGVFMSLFCENGEYPDERSDGWERYFNLTYTLIPTALCQYVFNLFQTCLYSECASYVDQRWRLSPPRTASLYDALCSTLLIAQLRPGVLLCQTQLSATLRV